VGFGAEPQLPAHFCGIVGPRNASGDSNLGLLSSPCAQFSRPAGKIQGLFKHFQGPYLFSSTFKSFEFVQESLANANVKRATAVHV